MKKVLFVAALGCVAAASFGQQQLSNTQLGVSGGLYFPTGSVLKNAVGSQIFTYGISPVSATRPSEGSITPSFNIISGHSSGSSFLLIPVTLGYEYHFGNTGSTSFQPYARLEAGGAYYNYNINEAGNANVTANRIGYVGDAELGVIISSNIHVSAKYYYFEQESGVSFNGFQVGLTVGLFRL